MRSRLFNFLSCLLLSATAAQSALAVDITTQRQYYDEAKRALAKGDDGPYQRYAAALQDYPLQPYLAYDELTARLKSASNSEIEKFLAEHGDLPQASWMKLRWLRWLAERGEWSTFLNYYDPALNFTELDCLYGQYLLSHGSAAEANAAAEKLWLVGKSQPQACDVLFERWAARGQLSETLRWQRAKLAAEARNYGLASHLVKNLPSRARQGARVRPRARGLHLRARRGLHGAVRPVSAGPRPHHRRQWRQRVHRRSVRRHRPGRG